MPLYAALLRVRRVRSRPGSKEDSYTVMGSATTPLHHSVTC